MLVKRKKTWYNNINIAWEVPEVAERMNVRHVAELAKLTLTPEEEARISEEMKGILAFACQLQQLDLEHVQPTRHIQPLVNVMRDDTVQPSMEREQILAAAPARVDDFIAVPRAVE